MIDFRNFHSLRLYSAQLLKDILPYTSYDIGQEEYVGKFHGTVAQCVKALKCKGYSYQLFAATKKLDGQVDSASFSRIPEIHPNEAHGTALEELSPSECQYHLHLFKQDKEVALYGHYEIHPYPHIPYWDINRPYPRHYRPVWDGADDPKEEWTYLRGVIDPRVEELLI